MEIQEKLQRTFVREAAYSKLRDWIIQGKFAAGHKLRDKELAEQLGVSRTPIREALLRLEEEGLVQTKPNCSTLVAPIEIQHACHLYSIVWSLEQLALKQAFESITEAHIEEMNKANQRLLQALQKGDRLLAVEADNHFHSVYIQLSKNEELQRILLEVKTKLNRLELYYFDKVTDAHVSCEEHCQLIEALKHKNLTLALAAIELNWNASLLRIQSQNIQS